MSRYRQNIEFDKVGWGTHACDCYPGNCPMRVYVKDGIVVREEASGTIPPVNERVPDFNPMGCMQGSCWNHSLYGPERVTHPLKRAGERGEGKWERITWDEALHEIADRLIDAIEDHGPRSIIRESTPETVVTGPLGRFFGLLGGTTLDMIAVLSDFNSGVYESFGKHHVEGSADDWFHSELLLFWHSNPVYTRIPFFHFFTEARYNGAEIVNISPDVNPSHIHADYQINVKGGSDAALGLALVQVMFDEDIAHSDFLREQTDMPLLVRTDDGRYLRQTDVEGEGREDQLYHWDVALGLVQADRGSLDLKGASVALEGAHEVSLHDGSTVTVEPVCQVLRKHLDAHYTPELQQPITGVHPESVRLLARKLATKRTNIVHGMNAAKMYHGDLIERAMCLVLAASGNWGKRGTGIRTWAVGMHDGGAIAMGKERPGAQAAEVVLANRDEHFATLKELDPTFTDELVASEVAKGRRGILGLADSRKGDDVPAAGGVPPVFYWNNHGEYNGRYNNGTWSDATMARSFDEYLNEAVAKGWWDGLDHPRKEAVPQVYLECGGNTLRRTRGGRKALSALLENLATIIVIDFRMTATAQYADYVLPAAQHYEKIAFSIPGPYTARLTFSDHVVGPAGESKNEWEMFQMILGAMAERARERGLVSYTDPTGAKRIYGDLLARYTMDGYYRDQDTVADEQIRDSALAGTLPAGTTLDDLREHGFVRFIDMGKSMSMLSQATDLTAGDVITPFTKHVETHEPFPTYCRRAQFYIDHDWFIEAGEQLPTHKPNPTMGGDYPLGMTSGHNRWSVHSINHFNETVLGTHRGVPTVMVNTEDAAARGVSDDAPIRIFNDVGEFQARAKVACNIRPGQIVSYNGWDPLQYQDWLGANAIEPGMVKWLHLAGGYGHLKYSSMHWQPCPSDRWVRCDFEAADQGK